MGYKKILLTGGSGNLGQTIIKSGYFPNILAPSHKTLDITKPKTLEKFFAKNHFDAIIHCAALARMAECEKNPLKAIETNIIGTSNLVMEVIKKESISNVSIRFIYISTDGVYHGSRGNYSEQDATIPYNKYGWTKLGGECVVNLLLNYCIIRTSFFNPQDIRFDYSAIDIYSSKIPINYLVQAIAIMLENSFIGTINIGGERKSDYEKYKEFKPSLKPCTREDISKNLCFKIAYDASFNFALWNEIVNQKNVWQ